MKAPLIGVAIAALVLVNTHVPDIADAAQFKPVIRTPRIIVRPPNVTPQTKRLLKKNTVKEVTNPAATQGGSAPEADSPFRSRAPTPLRGRNRAAAPIPQPRPRPFNEFEENGETVASMEDTLSQINMAAAVEDLIIPALIQKLGSDEVTRLEVKPGDQIQATSNDVIRFPDLDGSQITFAIAGLNGQHLVIILPGGLGELLLLDFQDLLETDNPARIDWGYGITSTASISDVYNRLDPAAGEFERREPILEEGNLATANNFDDLLFGTPFPLDEFGIGPQARSGPGLPEDEPFIPPDEPTAKTTKKYTPSEVTNPEGAYAADADNRLRRRTRVAAQILQLRSRVEDQNRQILTQNQWRLLSLLEQFLALSIQDPDNSDETQSEIYEEVQEQRAAAASEDEDDDPDDCSTLLLMFFGICV